MSSPCPPRKPPGLRLDRKGAVLDKQQRISEIRRRVVRRDPYLEGFMSIAWRCWLSALTRDLAGIPGGRLADEQGSGLSG
jgi:hypothetical protein